MHLNVLVALFTLFALVCANDRHVRLAKRQSASASTTSTSASSTDSSSSSLSSSGSSLSVSATASAPSNSSYAPTTPVGTSIPPLSQITSGMPTPTTLPVSTTYPVGATPPISGAPPLPTPFVFYAADWPSQDQVAPTNTTDVAQWMTELDGFVIPDIPPTVDGTCLSDPAAAANASARGWWTCGGYTRATDITTCNDRLTWGVSFDDGPGPNSQELLDYLAEWKIPATFFIIGSRAVERSQVLVEEYMAGHEICVHTWSHRASTMLTTAQVVAELGYARKVIKQITGVTPTCWRPPFGDVDDRIRAISMAMGMRTIIWTKTPSGVTFDTNDWKVVTGAVSGAQSFATFQAILSNATTLDSGFIVLKHDMWSQTVDLAIGYTLPAAMNFTPSLKFDAIGACNNIPATDMYRESNTNKSFPFPNTTVAGGSSSTGGSGGSGSSASGASGSGVTALNAALSVAAGIAPLLAFATLLL